MPALYRSVITSRMPLDLPDFSEVRADRLGARVLLRSAAPADRQQIQALVGSLGETSRYFRFFQAKRSLSDSELSSLLGETHGRSACLLAFVDSHPGPVAFAQYAVTEDASADIAFAVLDDWQGRGIGTILFESLADVASRCGIERFTADVMGSNVRMLEVFENAGCRVKRHWEEGSVHVEMELRGGAVFSVARMLRSFVAWMAAADAKDRGITSDRRR